MLANSEFYCPQCQDTFYIRSNEGFMSQCNDCKKDDSIFINAGQIKPTYKIPWYEHLLNFRDFGERIARYSIEHVENEALEYFQYHPPTLNKIRELRQARLDYKNKYIQARSDLITLLNKIYGEDTTGGIDLDTYKEKLKLHCKTDLDTFTISTMIHEEFKTQIKTTIKNYAEFQLLKESIVKEFEITDEELSQINLKFTDPNNKIKQDIKDFILKKSLYNYLNTIKINAKKYLDLHYEVIKCVRDKLTYEESIARLR
jgi:hypothetical protein